MIIYYKTKTLDKNSNGKKGGSFDHLKHQRLIIIITYYYYLN
jgi:hypothetical protein